MVAIGVFEPDARCLTCGIGTVSGPIDSPDCTSCDEGRGLPDLTSD